MGRSGDLGVGGRMRGGSMGRRLLDYSDRTVGNFGENVFQ